MNLARVLFVGGLIAAAPLRAVYAPLPEQEQNKAWTATLRAGVTHDSNIFGSAAGAIDSLVYEAAPKVAFSGSLDDRTFAEFSYGLTVDHFVDRPGDKTLVSHGLAARLAHAFSAATSLDVSEDYQFAKNPESLLAGVPVNTDQSYQRNELDGRFTTAPLPKFGATAKVRSVLFRYDNDALARSLDRLENLYGLSGSYDVLPGTKAVAEYRHEDIYYRKAGEAKNKRTDFALVGLDYAVARKLSLSGRVGNSWRHRSAERSAGTPYAELSAKYDYARGSYAAFGYAYTYEETSNVFLYNDTKVNRLFLNVRHALSALIAASASVDYEPSQLQGRRGIADVDETTTRAGLALTWSPTLHWAASATWDYDHVDSDDPGRTQDRNRYGVNVAYSF